MLEHLIGVSLRVAFVGSAGLVAAWCLRRRGAEARHAVWVAVLAGMMLMPFLTMGLPPLRVLPDLNAKSPAIGPAADFAMPDLKAETSAMPARPPA